MILNNFYLLWFGTGSLRLSEIVSDFILSIFLLLISFVLFFVCFIICSGGIEHSTERVWCKLEKRKLVILSVTGDENEIISSGRNQTGLGVHIFCVSYIYLGWIFSCVILQVLL